MDQLQQTSNKNFTVLGSIKDLSLGQEVCTVRAPWPFVDTTGSPVILGNHVVINAGVYIHTHSHEFNESNWRSLPILVTPGPTAIEAYAFLGVNVQIMHTCKRIGVHSVIGAGSIVTQNVPDNEIWAGNPARKIGDVRHDQQSGVRQETQARGNPGM